MTILAAALIVGLLLAICLIPAPHTICPQCGERVQFAGIKTSLLAKHLMRRKWNGVLFEKECKCR